MQPVALERSGDRVAALEGVRLGPGLGAKSGGVRRYIRGKMAYLSMHPALEHMLVILGAEDLSRRENGSRVYEIESLPILGSPGVPAAPQQLQDARRHRSGAARRPGGGNAYRPAWVAVEPGERSHTPVVAFYHSDFPRVAHLLLRRPQGGPSPGSLAHTVRPHPDFLFLCQPIPGSCVEWDRTLHALATLAVLAAFFISKYRPS